MGKWIVLFAVLACLVLHATHGISKVRGRFQNITTRFRGYINNVTLGPQREDAFCGEGKCRCSGNVADCSGNEAGLTYIPKLPDDISIVYFSKYGLKVIDNDDFFRNVTNITVLNLSNNGLTNISEGAFRPVHRLAVLTLDANSLTYDSLVPVFSVSTLVRLSITGNNPGLGALPDGIFYTHPMPQLQSLSLAGNHISKLNLTELSPLLQLQELDVGNNHISAGFISSSLPKMETLNLGMNGMFDFPETCHEGKSLFPRLVTLFMFENLLSKLPQDVCLPNLNYLDLSGNYFSDLTTDMFGQQNFPSLQAVFLNSLRVGMKTIESSAFNNTSLQTLTLAFRFFDIATALMDSDAFAGCPNLRSLDLTYVDLSDLDDKSLMRLFRHLKNLRFLQLNFAGISKITLDTFQHLKLLQGLSLNNNKLTSLPDGVFDAHTNLQTVSMSQNEITTIRKATFGPSTRKRLQQLVLNDNPFLCDCDLRWFQRWLTENPSLFQTEHLQYMCDNLADERVESFFVPGQACIWSQETSMFVSTTLVILIFVLTLVSLLYRYRWHIRLVLYEAFRGREDRWRRLQEQHFQYDVFVSYDSEDELWVQQHLMPKLEERLGLRLCLHERDFIPGKNIVDNIVHCVQNSKKVMMLFSTNFSESPWCQFELNLCLSHVMENDDMLLVVMLEDIPSRDLTPAMMAVMKTTTFIEWFDHDDARASFWGRLLIALTEIMTSG